jgi:hypothetical protein
MGTHTLARDAASGVGGIEENDMRKRRPRRPVRISSGDTVNVGACEQAELWQAASFAASWFRDALADAQHAKGDIDARRRQIVFAVCCVESYLFEWTRGLVGPREIERYFPPRRKLGIREKWKQVLGELAAHKKVPGAPSFGGVDWSEFVKLVDYRDGLIHASASRPTSPSKPDATPPVPPVDLLQSMEPGWPVRVVATLMRNLHAAVGSATPRWLVNP